jgi:hypothetical protein
MLRRIQPGTVLDGFRVESALHAGGNGYVYMVTPVAPRAYDIPLVMKVPGIGHVVRVFERQTTGADADEPDSSEPSQSLRQGQ